MEAQSHTSAAPLPLATSLKALHRLDVHLSRDLHQRTKRSSVFKLIASVLSLTADEVSVFPLLVCFVFITTHQCARALASVGCVLVCMGWGLSEECVTCTVVWCGVQWKWRRVL